LSWPAVHECSNGGIRPDKDAGEYSAYRRTLVYAEGGKMLYEGEIA
jgi:hypothetical protein